MKKEQILLDYDAAEKATYIGKAQSGALTSQNSWSITKIIENENGQVISIQNSEGLADQIFKWDDRKTLEYK